MSNVLVTNTTNVDQTVIIIPENHAMVLSPDSGAIIDTYNKNHSYLYKSYMRKGLKVEVVDDSIFDNADLTKLVDPDKKEDLLTSIDENASVVTGEVKTEEEKPKRKSKKSNKEVSESSEEVSATESGE